MADTAKARSVLLVVALGLGLVASVTFFVIGPRFVDLVNGTASPEDRTTSQGALAVCAAFAYALAITLVSYRKERKTGEPLYLDIPTSWNPWLTAALAIVLALIIALKFVT